MGYSSTCCSCGTAFNKNKVYCNVCGDVACHDCVCPVNVPQAFQKGLSGSANACRPCDSKIRRGAILTESPPGPRDTIIGLRGVKSKPHSRSISKSKSLMVRGDNFPRTRTELELLTLRSKVMEAEKALHNVTATIQSSLEFSNFNGEKYFGRIGTNAGDFHLPPPPAEAPPADAEQPQGSIFGGPVYIPPGALESLEDEKTAQDSPSEKRKKRKILMQRRSEKETGPLRVKGIDKVIQVSKENSEERESDRSAVKPEMGHIQQLDPDASMEWTDEQLRKFSYGSMAAYNAIAAATPIESVIDKLNTARVSEDESVSTDILEMIRSKIKSFEIESSEQDSRKCSFDDETDDPNLSMSTRLDARLALSKKMPMPLPEKNQLTESVLQLDAQDSSGEEDDTIEQLPVLSSIERRLQKYDSSISTDTSDMVEFGNIKVVYSNRQKVVGEFEYLPNDTLRDLKRKVETASMTLMYEEFHFMHKGVSIADELYDLINVCNLGDTAYIRKSSLDVWEKPGF